MALPDSVSDRLLHWTAPGDPQRGTTTSAADETPVDIAPGIAVGISVRGVTSIGSAGFRHVFDQDGTLANPLAVNPTTKQDMASVTKLVATASAVTTLSEAAGWLDTPVRHYLPRFTGGVKDLITIRDLLSHQAGLWEWWPIYIDLADDDPVSVAAELPLRYPRHHGYHYSDIGYMLLGGILENAFAAPLDVVIRQQVLETCGLTETSYAKPIVDETGLDVMAGPVHGDEIERSRLLQGQPYPVPRHPSQFQQWRSHTLIDEVHDGNAFHAFGGVASHAGLFSSIPDLLRWGDCLNRSLAGDGPFNRVGTAQLFEPIQAQDPSLRLGVRTWPASTECAATVYGRAGFTGTYVAVLPDHGATVVTLCNRLHVPGHDAPSTSLDIWHDVLAAAHRYIDEVTGPIR